jgi:uncharacterized protein
LLKIITKQMNLEEAKKLGIDSWDKWECEPSEFEWEYPETETAYVFEGNIIVTTEYETVTIKGNMLVTFPAGLKCSWKVIETIRKVYTFENKNVNK